MLERTWLDRAIGLVSPRTEFKRLQYRAAARTLTAHYEGGSTGRRTDNWRAPSTGPTAASAITLPKLRDRSRDLVRNNPWARNAIEDLENDVVGTGIVPKIVARTKRGQAAVVALWKAWAETTACDADGLNDFFGLQALAFRTIAESGEVLIRRRRRRPEDGLPIPLQLQILEPDFLDTSRDVVNDDGSRIIGGVAFDVLGRRTGYWLFPEHPGEAFGRFISGRASSFVPASEILHVYRVERSGQVRGIPWGASAVVRLRDFDEFEDAHLVRQKIAACFSVFIYDAEGTSPAALAGTPDDSPAGKKPPVERVYPGMIERLEPGKEISFAAPPGVQDHESYSRSVLRGIAAGFGTTYEALTGDLSNVNYSSARMGWLKHRRRLEAWRWRIVVPRLCSPVFAWFLELADVAAGLDVREVTATWTPPRADMIDPTKEVVATRSEIRAGLKSWPAAVRERGDDPDELLDELEQHQKDLDKRGLVLESDARRPSNGQPGDGSATPGNPPAGNTPAEDGSGDTPADPKAED
jgi:lambda family phage portal protein